MCSRTGALAVLFPNSHGDWLCGACSEWHYLYLLDPDLRRPADETRFDLRADLFSVSLELEPWELPGYVPEGAEPIS